VMSNLDDGFFLGARVKIPLHLGRVARGRGLDGRGRGRWPAVSPAQNEMIHAGVTAHLPSIVSSSRTCEQHVAGEHLFLGGRGCLAFFELMAGVWGDLDLDRSGYPRRG